MIPAEEIDDLSDSTDSSRCTAEPLNDDYLADVPEKDRRAEIYDQPEFEAVHDLAHKRLSPEEAAEEARKLLAMRQLARKRLLPFVMTFRPGYKAGWMHRRICQELEQFLDDVVKGKSPRLMLFMPPRSGKSELGSRSFPAWAIGKYPWLEIISTSYAASLANSFSRKAREILRDTVFAKIFPDCILDKDNQSVEQWMTTEGGGYVSAGVMGSIVGKGAHCFPAGTMVTLADGSTMDISEESIVGKDVLSMEFAPARQRCKKVTAWQEVSNDSGLYRVTTRNGVGGLSTGDHPYYVSGRGWLRADSLRAGYVVLTVSGSNVQADTVSEVVRAGDCNVPVYDIQVEDTECFFANGILVHNCLIIDDPTKGKAEARSETIQEQIRDWYTSSAYTRLAPGGGVLIIMQRWTEDDLAGWLLEEDAAKPEELRENWNVIRFPAIAEEDEEFRLKGEALHPERYPLELLNRIKATLGDADFSALYQQNPLPDSGDYFKDSDFKWYNPTECPPLSELNVYAAWDLAIGEKQKNDQSVGVYVGLDCNGKMWVLHIEATRKNSLALAKTIFELNDIYKPINTGFEKGHIEGTMGPFLEKMMLDGDGSFFPYEALPVGNQDKSARATTIRGLMQHGIVWFRKFDANQEAAKAEMLKFPNGKHDDNVDAMAHIGRMVESLVAKRVHTEKKKDTWRDKFMKKMMKEMRKKGLR